VNRYWFAALCAITLVAVSVLAVRLVATGPGPSVDRSELQYQPTVSVVSQSPPFRPAEATSSRTEITVAATGPTTFPVTKTKERSAGEWQGMLIDLAIAPPCLRNEPCSLARACKDGFCTACWSDVDCAADEGCVLDHCVLRSQIECRRRSDCAAPSLCVLSGYSSGRRGNEDMKAFCLDPNGGAIAQPPALPAPENSAPRPSPYADELARARQAAGATPGAR
jgi:hypothetical protein